MTDISSKEDKDWITALAVTPDGRQIVSGSYDNTIKVWDLESGQLLRTLSGHKAGISDLLMTPDGKQVVSGSFDSTFKVWNLETGKMIRSFEGTRIQLQA